MLKDYGHAVGILDKIVPAINIQVENIPEGYGVYFEIMFEDGDLWVVEQDTHKNDPVIYVTEHKDFAHTPWDKDCEEYLWGAPDWETFIMFYVTKNQR